MKSTSKAVQASDPADFAPGDIAHNTARKHFEASSAPMVERNRSLLISAGLLLVVVLEAITINSLLPLKEVIVLQPQKVESGRVVADTTPVGSFTVDREMTGYFLNQWAKSLFEINGRLMVEKSTRAALEMAVGAAKEQLREMRSKENPFLLLADSPQLTRDYEYLSINFLSQNDVILRFATITRRPGTVPKTEYFVLAATVTRIPPTTKEEYMRNPTGLYVKHFTKSEETTPK